MEATQYSAMTCMKILDSGQHDPTYEA